MSGWLQEYSYKCQPVDYSHNPTAVRVGFSCSAERPARLLFYNIVVTAVVKYRNLKLEIHLIFTNSVHASQKTCCISITNTKQ
jgi:hypothetical protein